MNQQLNRNAEWNDMPTNDMPFDFYSFYSVVFHLLNTSICMYMFSSLQNICKRQKKYYSSSLFAIVLFNIFTFIMMQQTILFRWELIPTHWKKKAWKSGESSSTVFHFLTQFLFHEHCYLCQSRKKCYISTVFHHINYLRFGNRRQICASCEWWGLS